MPFLQKFPIQKLLFGLFIAFLFGLLGWISFNANNDGDVFWHLAMGRDFIEKGLSPFKDHYSFTYPGVEIKLTPVPYQILLWGFHQTFGEFLGPKLLTMVFCLLAFSILLGFAYKLKTPWYVSAPTLLFMVSGLAQRSLIRPETTAFSLILIFIFLFLRARANFSLKNVALLNLLLLIWTNVHITSMFGFIVIEALYFEKIIGALNKKDYQSIFRLTVLSGLGFLVGFCNPSLTHPIVFALKTDPNWKYLITEHFETSFFAQTMWQLLFWLVSAFFFIWCLFKKKFSFALIILVLGYQSWKVNKILPYFVTAELPLLLVSSSEFLSSLRTIIIENRVRKRLTVSFLAVSGFAFSFIFMAFVYYGFSVTNTARLYNYTFAPVKITDWLEKNRFNGRIFAAHELAPYLFYKLPGKIKVYIDGRTNILYPIKHMAGYFDLLTSIDPFVLEMDRYDIQDLVFPIDDQRGKHLLLSGLFNFAFTDATHAHFIRKTGQFPVSSMLFGRAECWDQSLTADLRNELDYAEKALPSDSQLLQFIRFAYGFGSATDQKQFLENPSCSNFYYNSVLRLGLYLSLKNGFYDTALKYFDSIRVPSNKDRLYAIKVLIDKGKTVEAENQIIFLLKEEKSLFDADVLLTLVKELKIKHRSEKITDEAIQELKNKAELYRSALPKISSKLKDFCKKKGAL